MTTFPSIAVNSRTYVPGNVPSRDQISLDGSYVSFRRGARRVNQVLSLGFSNLTQSDMVLLKDHYIARKGTFEVFYLPSTVWGDYSSSPVGVEFAWRYIAPPEITDTSFDRFNVSIELQTVSINTSDLHIDGENADPNTPERLYTIDAGTAAATPARTHNINPGLAR